MVDALGHPVGIVVNGNHHAAELLSIENVLEPSFPGSVIPSLNLRLL